MAACPYPGLAAFDQARAHLFFGRNDHIGQIVDRLTRQRFQVVMGPSGAGKSSLVHAGIVPRLASGLVDGAVRDWRVVSCTPGADPIGRLIAALHRELADPADPGSAERIDVVLRDNVGGLAQLGVMQFEEHEGLLVVVDQFEELFRYADQPGPRNSRDAVDHFVALLTTAALQEAANISVVITIRSEFLGRCTEVIGLVEAVNEGGYQLPLLRVHELKETIVGPARIAGVEVHSAVLSAILADAEMERVSLPVLQHALMRTWNAWESGTGPRSCLNPEAYKQVGCLTGALDRHGDEVLRGLSDQDQILVERAFKRLTWTNPSGTTVRRPTSLGDLAACADQDSDDGLQRVLEVLGPYLQEDVAFLRLVGQGEPSADTIVDLTHEAVIDGWSQLSAWVAQESRSTARFLVLDAQARQWKQKQGDALREAGLAIAKGWQKAQRPTAAWAAQALGLREVQEAEARLALVGELIDESKALVERDRALAAKTDAAMAAKRAAEAETKAQRLKYRSMALMAVATTLLLVATTLLFLNEWRNKNMEEQIIARERASAYIDEIHSLDEETKTLEEERVISKKREERYVALAKEAERRAAVFKEESQAAAEIERRNAMWYNNQAIAARTETEELGDQLENAQEKNAETKMGLESNLAEIQAELKEEKSRSTLRGMKNEDLKTQVSDLEDVIEDQSESLQQVESDYLACKSTLEKATEELSDCATKIGTQEIATGIEEAVSTPLEDVETEPEDSQQEEPLPP